VASQPAVVTDPTLVVDVDSLARRLGFDTPVDSETAETLRQAILDAQADVVSYLGRPIVPTQVTARGLWAWGTNWADAIDDSDFIEIVSVTPEVYIDTGQPSGTFTVVYLAGLDAVNDPALEPIRRYVAAAARNDAAVIDIWRERVQPRGAMTSVSTDGQSASFAAATQGGGGSPGSNAPGALPKLESLFAWKRGGVFQRRGFPVSPGPWW
jgi:hypothetical protein